MAEGEAPVHSWVALFSKVALNRICEECPLFRTVTQSLQTPFC